MKLLIWLAGIVTLVGTLVYVFVYLHRWEWHRAILVGILFLASEVALGVAILMHRLAAIERMLAEKPRADAAPVRSRLVDAVPERRPFAWLAPKAGQVDVFIPILLGSGAAVSAVAWVVERIAEKSTEPALVASIERDLAALSLPDGLVATDDQIGPDAQLPAGDAVDFLLHRARPR